MYNYNFNTHQYNLMDWCELNIAYNSSARILQRSCMQYKSIHQTIGNESRFSLFIGEQSDECDIKDIGHDHEGWVMKNYVSILSVQYSIFMLQYMES